MNRSVSYCNFFRFSTFHGNTENQKNQIKNAQENVRPQPNLMHVSGSGNVNDNMNIEHAMNFIPPANSFNVFKIELYVICNSYSSHAIVQDVSRRIHPFDRNTIFFFFLYFYSNGNFFPNGIKMKSSEFEIVL